MVFQVVIELHNSKASKPPAIIHVCTKIEILLHVTQLGTLICLLGRQPFTTELK